MTNLLVVLPDFDIGSFSHIVPSLEKALISTADLLTLDALDIAKRAHVPTEEVKRLVHALLLDLRREPDSNSAHGLVLVPGDRLEDQHVISLLDDKLDAALNGGIHTGFLTEVAGESAAGKTQFLMTLLLSVQLRRPSGEQKHALYISTEAQLPTQRLAQILDTHPKLKSLDSADRPSLSRVHSTHIHDLEAQEHILRYQVPVIVRRHDIGLLIVDSIAANYRAEFDKGKSQKSSESFAKRSLQISKLGVHLRELARSCNIAIVVANQVADRFDVLGSNLNQLTQRSNPASPPRESKAAILLSPEISLRETAVPSTDDVLSLDHQQRFFSGWGDEVSVGSLKNPSLGLTWTNQLATRIVLLKEPIYDQAVGAPGEDKVLLGWKREIKLVFSSWAAPGRAHFDIWQGGIREAETMALS
ncbi:hypothetical protein AMS68_007017 [Peltaster fructicola]|uniref:RecA family profile 1 domain-containing protein n=1 Tax=Peltaster fructicola TaxID=286661 RepID=A0A6H0Y4G4_9PEZI|nr:hypothetical protein AMS68_007017 [Peltaster fructicola]